MQSGNLLQFIILNRFELSYRIIAADTPINAIRKYLLEQAICADHLKVFDILSDSGKMEIQSLIRYANEQVLCDYNAIHEIYTLGERIAEE